MLLFSLRTSLKGFVVFLIMRCAVGLIGFDCHHSDIKIRAISLNGVNSCPSIGESSQAEIVNLQLLQRKETQRIGFIQCYIGTTTIIQYCGMHSHISAVAGGFIERIIHLTKTECQGIVDTRSYRWDHDHMTRLLPINGTYSESFTLVGSVSTDGLCKGGNYHANGREYQSVLVTLFVFQMGAFLIIQKDKP